MKLYGIVPAALLLIFPLHLLNAEPLGKIRAPKIVVEKSVLEGVADGQTLYFTSQYNNRSWKRDQVLLAAYRMAGDGKTVLETEDFETIGNGETFDNELRYSTYRVVYSDARAIIDAYSHSSEVVYFLLEPVKFKSDNRFLAYRVRPADADRKPIDVALVQKQGKGGTEAAQERLFYLNPSPPARDDVTLDAR